jgi:hypothetical protein
MKTSFQKKLFASFVVIVFLFVVIAAYAQNVSRQRHPNLWAAQTFIEKAIQKVSAAQVANEYDMDGHAAKAKGLLDKAYDEIKLAALAANK